MSWSERRGYADLVAGLMGYSTEKTEVAVTHQFNVAEIEKARVVNRPRTIDVQAKELEEIEEGGRRQRRISRAMTFSSLANRYCRSSDSVEPPQIFGNFLHDQESKRSDNQFLAFTPCRA